MRAGKFRKVPESGNIAVFRISTHLGVPPRLAKTSIIGLFAFLVLGGRVVPHHFEFDAEHRILLVVMEGDIDGPEIIQIDREMRAQIQLTQPLVGISDLTAVTRFNVPGEIIRSLAGQKPAPFPPETLRFMRHPISSLG